MFSPMDYHLLLVRNVGELKAPGKAGSNSCSSKHLVGWAAGRSFLLHHCCSLLQWCALLRTMLQPYISCAVISQIGAWGSVQQFRYLPKVIQRWVAKLGFEHRSLSQVYHCQYRSRTEGITFSLFLPPFLALFLLSFLFPSFPLFLLSFLVSFC